MVAGNQEAVPMEMLCIQESNLPSALYDQTVSTSKCFMGVQHQTKAKVNAPRWHSSD